MDELAKCSKDQLLLFFDKAKKLDARRRADFVLDVRAAVWADGDAVSRLINALEKLAE